MRTVWLCALAAACSATPMRKKITARAQAVEAAPERLEPDAALAELRTSILDGYRLLSQGYDNVYLEGVSREPKLIVIDVEPGDVLVGAYARAAEVRALVAGERFQIASKNLEVNLAADGSCAWAHDDLAYRLIEDGRRASFPLRATSVFERHDGRWQKVLEHVSYAVPGPLASSEGAGPPMAASIPEGEDAARARDLVLSLINVADFRPPVTDRTIVIAADGREQRGAAAAALAAVSGARVVALRVELSTTKTVAWVAAQLDVGGLPARGTWVLERQDGDLRLVQAHVSLAVPGPHLARDVFGR